MQTVFDLPTMASQTHVPNSHRTYDLEADGITITAHTPPKRLGANGRDITNWTRSGGKSKDDPCVIDDDEEIQEVHATSSKGLSRPGTSWQTATNPDMVVSTTLAFLFVVGLRFHFRIQLSVLRRSKPRIRSLKFGATLAQALQQSLVQQSLVHAITVLNTYHISLLDAQGLFPRLGFVQHRMGPFSRPHRAFPAREKAQNHQI